MEIIHLRSRKRPLLDYQVAVDALNRSLLFSGSKDEWGYEKWDAIVVEDEAHNKLGFVLRGNLSKLVGQSMAKGFLRLEYFFS